MNKIEFVLHEQVTEAELSAIIAGAETSNAFMRKTIAQNDHIIGMAKLRLLSREIAEAERE